jgi:hypothetical protein
MPESMARSVPALGAAVYSTRNVWRHATAQGARIRPASTLPNSAIRPRCPDRIRIPTIAAAAGVRMALSER